MRAVPVYFGPEERPLFGWLHETGQPSRLGLVLCNPFGFEAICSQRSLRHFAEAAAAAGVPSLRFDYDGTGDSAGDDRDPARLAAWVSSVHHAIALLRQRASVEGVVLLGVRLGALLATLAAVERDDIEGLIAVAPVVAGKPYLRELRALQMQIGLRDPPPGAPVEEGVQEASGFVLTADTRTALGKADLGRLEKPPAPSVLLLERDDLPGPDAWADRLTSQGVAVDRRRLPGYVDMMLNPEHAQVPEAMVRATIEWLGSRLGSPRAVPVTPAAARRPTSGTRIPIGAGRTVLERAEHLDGRLFGILSGPESGPPSGRGILLLNAGAVGRIGLSRMHVTLARRWAALGHTVLRLDLGGLGDSAPRSGRPENVVYTDEANQEIADAIAFMRRQPGVVEVHALGLCSGGYNAFKAAVAGLPLDGVVVINPLTFFYKPGLPPPPIVLSEYARRVTDLEAWKKLLGGGDVRVLAERVAQKAYNLLRDRLREAVRLGNVNPQEDLAAELESIARRRIPLRFIFGSGEPGLSMLRNQGGRTMQRLHEAGALGIEVIDGPDHNFMPVWSHAALIAALAAHLDGPTGRRR